MTDATEALEPYALYRWFDVKVRLLYIGKTGELAQRFSGHIARSRWMQLAASSTVERYGTAEEVGRAEREAIETEQPLFNKQHNDTPEAKRRLHAYLEEVGRLDLLYPKQTAMLLSEEDYQAKQATRGVSPARGPAEPAEEHDPAACSPGYVVTDLELAGYLARWERRARASWWRPWWLEHDPFAAEDLLDMICPAHGITEAIGVCLRARRHGQDWPLAWVTQANRDDPDGYGWSAHVDFTFCGEDVLAGIVRDEMSVQRTFAEALVKAGHCSIARLGEQVILTGFESRTEAQFAGVILRQGGEEMMMDCMTQMRRIRTIGAEVLAGGKPTRRPAA